MKTALELKELVEQGLDGYFQKKPDTTLYRAMRYSISAGGKRIRPILLLAFTQACGGDIDAALPASLGIEMLHTYSLIHDDLPCMDDDDLRRGMPTNHKVYGEAQAVIAGDALQTEAFKAVLSCKMPFARIARMAQTFCEGAGADGMCHGQSLDIMYENTEAPAETVLEIHECKTAALLIAACKMGVIAAGGTPEQEAAAVSYAKSLGVAFQVRDDMLDVISTAETLGKTPGKDERSGKNTFVSLYGMEQCAKIIERETLAAVKAAEGAFKTPELLRDIALSLAARDK